MEYRAQEYFAASYTVTSVSLQQINQNVLRRKKFWLARQNALESCATVSKYSSAFRPSPLSCAEGKLWLYEAAVRSSSRLKGDPDRTNHPHNAME